MRRIGFFVLALIANLSANVIADDKENIQHVATHFETDTQTIEVCLSEAELTVEEMHIAEEKWEKIKQYEDLDEETKKSPTKQGRFVACILEKKDMIKDSRIVVGKILEMVDRKQIAILSKEVLTQCLSSLNEDIELTREDRALGSLLCITSNETNIGEKLKNGKKH